MPEILIVHELYVQHTRARSVSVALHEWYVHSTCRFKDSRCARMLRAFINPFVSVRSVLIALCMYDKCIICVGSEIRAVHE